MSTPNIPPLFKQTFNHLREAIENEDLSDATKTLYLKALDSIKQDPSLMKDLMVGAKGSSVKAESRLAERLIKHIEDMNHLTGDEVQQRRGDLIKKTVALASAAGVAAQTPKGAFKSYEIKELDAKKSRDAFTSAILQQAEGEGIELTSATKDQLHSAFNKTKNDLTAKVANGTCSPEDALIGFLDNVQEFAIQVTVHQVDRDTFCKMCQKGNELSAYMSGQLPSIVMVEINGRVESVEIKDLYNSASGISGELEPWPAGETRRVTVFPLYRDEQELLEKVCTDLLDDGDFTKNLFHYFEAVEQDTPKSPKDSSDDMKPEEPRAVKFGQAHIQNIEYAAKLSFDSLAEDPTIDAVKLRNAFINFMLDNVKFGRYTESHLTSAFDKAIDEFTSRVMDQKSSPETNLIAFVNYFKTQATEPEIYEVNREEFRAMCRPKNELAGHRSGQQPNTVKVEIGGKRYEVNINELLDSTSQNTDELELWPKGEVRKISIEPLLASEENMLIAMCNDLKENENFARSVRHYFESIENETNKS